MSYETVARLAQQGGLIYFGLIFIAGCVYALWPGNREMFSQAKGLPLEDDDL